MLPPAKYRLALALLLLLPLLTVSVPPIRINPLEECCLKGTPVDIQAHIKWPRIGKPAIVLNYSKLEVAVKAPSTINSWTFTLYREYCHYTLTYDTPVYNATSGTWRINVTIPAGARRDLYDLRVTLSDGTTEKTIEEWNAVQVRYSYPANFTIFHITDTHLFNAPTGESSRLLYSLYQAAMANADLVIITGDLVDDGASTSFRFFKEILSQSRVPTFICPGNHDADSTGNTFRTYKSFFGPDYYTANFGPDVFLVMANSHRDRIINSTQLGWIEQDMASSNAKFKILGVHHPLYDVEDPPTFFLEEDEAKELLNITQNYNVSMVLTGHRHNDRVDYVNGTLWVMTTANGGPVWKKETDPGHHQHGFRIIRVENYKVVSWNWTPSLPWSQPWDLVKLSRSPSYFREVDLGCYMTVTNNLSSPIVGQTLDFLLSPLSGAVYRVSGATVAETVNGTEAWLIRLHLDLGVNETTTIRIYPSNAQAPTLKSITYPLVALVNTTVGIYAEWENPVSGIHKVEINISINGEPFVTKTMKEISEGRFRYIKIFEDPASVIFTVTAYDYAGYKTTTQTYSFEVVSETSSPPPPTITTLPIVIGAGVTIAVVTVVIVAIIYYSSRLKGKKAS